MQTFRVSAGVGVLIILGICSRLLAGIIGINHLIGAIVIGAVIANAVGVPEYVNPGVNTHKLWLEAGIVLIGAGIVLDEVFSAGVFTLLLVVGVVSGSLLVAESLTRLLGVKPKLGSLLASGASICGVSAVVSVAGGIDASESHIAYASATILLFDALTIFLYPAAGHLLGLSDFVFGVWSGLTMFSTGPVTAVGFAYSTTAGEWATLTKLTRNAFIGVVTLLYVFWYSPDGAASADDQSGSWRGELTRLWTDFPKFFLGFIAMILLGNTVFSSETIQSLDNASNWLFLIAFVGLGLELRIENLRSAGVVPFLVVFLNLLLFSTLVLGLLLVTT
jgi:uncharacterized integral membrane protein (TIGR00698 family)